MNKRELNLKKYGISGKRYKELCGFCEQYPEWVEELKSYSFLGFRENDGMPKSPNVGKDTTAETAIRIEKLLSRVNLVEETAKVTDKDMWEFLIKGVCYNVPISYLQTQEGMGLSRSSFYERRRYFFYLLDKKKG